MLILDRKLHEVIKIGDMVDVVVLRCNGGVVRLGIRAPIDISVHREEIYQKIKKEKLKEKVSKVCVV